MFGPKRYRDLPAGIRERLLDLGSVGQDLDVVFWAALMGRAVESYLSGNVWVSML